MFHISHVLTFVLFLMKDSEAGFLHDINSDLPVAATPTHYRTSPVNKFFRSYRGTGNIKFAQPYNNGFIYASHHFPYLSSSTSYLPSINYQTRLHPFRDYNDPASVRSTIYQFATPLPVTPPYEEPVASVHIDNSNGPRTVLKYGPPITTTTTTTYTTQSHIAPVVNNNW